MRPAAVQRCRAYCKICKCQQTSDAESQYHCGRVDRGIQPPVDTSSNSPPPPPCHHTCPKSIYNRHGRNIWKSEIFRTNNTFFLFFPIPTNNFIIPPNYPECFGNWLKNNDCAHFYFKGITHNQAFKTIKLNIFSIVSQNSR